MAPAALLVGALTRAAEPPAAPRDHLAVGSSSRFLWHVLRLPSEFFQPAPPADISSRVGINDRVAQLLSRELATQAAGR
jgi:ABC-type bacteriocin/lantibiotic exporter with double-glycine peptidase domain